MGIRALNATILSLSVCGCIGDYGPKLADCVRPDGTSYVIGIYDADLMKCLPDEKMVPYASLSVYYQSHPEQR